MAVVALVVSSKSNNDIGKSNESAFDYHDICNF